MSWFQIVFLTSAHHCSQATEEQGGYMGPTDAGCPQCGDGLELHAEQSVNQRKLPAAVCYPAAATTEIKDPSAFRQGTSQTPGTYAGEKQMDFNDNYMENITLPNITILQNYLFTIKLLNILLVTHSTNVFPNCVTKLCLVVTSFSTGAHSQKAKHYSLTKVYFAWLSFSIGF